MKNLPFFSRYRFACNGIRSAFSTESSFRFQSIAAIGVLGALGLVKASPLWWATMLLTIGGVLSLEMLNTAIEHLVDRLHPEIHPSIKLVKDCASGAVLMMSFVSIGVFIAFLFDYFGHAGGVLS